MAASAATNMRMEDIVNACEALHLLIEDDNRINQEVVDAGVVPRLVALLDQMTSHDCLNLYILSILYNIASGTFDQAKAVVSAGAVDKVISLLGSPYPHVVNEEAVLVLANIAAKGPELGEHVMEKGIVKPLLALIKPDSSVS